MENRRRKARTTVSPFALRTSSESPLTPADPEDQPAPGADSVLKAKAAMNEIAVPNKFITKLKKHAPCPSKKL
jgi:hypothetical protein